MSLKLGYCTNVHAGADLEQTRANLQHYAVAVKEKFQPNGPMGVGLWLSAQAASSLRQEQKLQELADWLTRCGLEPFTLNGFPYGDFHQQIVKHQVYRPTWFERARLDYTLNLIEILDRLLPEGAGGSISTLPISWGDPAPTADQLARAADHLRQTAQRAARLEKETGRLIYLCIEPEPGCVFDRSNHIVRFFEDYLLPGGVFAGDTKVDEEFLRRHIRVCHDVCHAAVMFEPQRDALERFAKAGIGVGKVQVSSAVRLPLEELDAADRRAAIEQLAGFSEDRYLHQTCVSIPNGAGQKTFFFEDLPDALQAIKSEQGDDLLSGEWRVHFHVPVYLQQFGLLKTSQPQIQECLQVAKELTDCVHYEVETYAWGVLPEDLQQPDLAQGIADELQWFSNLSCWGGR